MLTWAKALILSSMALLIPVRPLIIAAVVASVIDCLLGIIAARKRGERVSSAGLRRTVAKITAYTMSIIAGHVVGVYLLGGVAPVASLVAGAIGVVEVTSCLENASAVVGQDVFGAVVAKLGSHNDRRRRRR